MVGGVGFYFRNVTEIVLFGVRGKDAQTIAPGRRQVNFLKTRKREHYAEAGRSYMTLSNLAVPDPIWSCLPGEPEKIGRRGEMNRQIIFPRGQHTRTIHKCQFRWLLRHGKTRIR